MNVRIDREGGPVEREKQRNGRRFGPHAVQLPEPLPGLVYGQTRQEVDVQLTALARNRAQHALDARPLLVGQASRADSRDDPAQRRIAHLLPLWETYAQVVECPPAIDIAGVLAQDAADQLAEGITPMARQTGLAIRFEEAPVDGERLAAQRLRGGSQMVGGAVSPRKDGASYAALMTLRTRAA